MQVVYNPKDTSTFASASLDRTVKVWSISQPTANFTLEGHEKGVNCVDYLTGGDRPYLVSGADDHTARVWDYQTKACVQVRILGCFLFAMAAFYLRWLLPTTRPGFGTTRRKRASRCGVCVFLFVSGADHHTARGWDYQTKACVQVRRVLGAPEPRHIGGQLGSAQSQAHARAAQQSTCACAAADGPRCYHERLEVPLQW